MGLFDRIFRQPAEPTGPPPSRLAELAAEFPFPVTAHHGANVEAELLDMRAEPATQKGLPVIVGDYERAARMLDVWDEPYSMPEQLAQLESTDFLKWIEARRSEDQEHDPQDHLKVYSSAVHPMSSLTIGRDFKGQPLHEVFIAHLPNEAQEMIPLHLRFGDWNACPSPFIHAAAARFWAPRYEARIVTATCDVIEYAVARPPESDSAAMELAWQQYLYCPDIVTQGVGSVATLAAILRGSSRWYFWWD